MELVFLSVRAHMRVCVALFGKKGQTLKTIIRL